MGDTDVAQVEGIGSTEIVCVRTECARKGGQESELLLGVSSQQRQNMFPTRQWEARVDVCTGTASQSRG